MNSYKLFFIMLVLITFFSSNALASENKMSSKETIEYWSQKREPRADRKAMKIMLINEARNIQEYYQGEEIVLGGIEVQVLYNDMSIDKITYPDKRLVVVGYDNSKIGEQLVEVHFKDENIDEFLYKFYVNVKEKTRGSKKVNTDRQIIYSYICTPPTKTTYLIGEEIDYTGMEVIICYENYDMEILEYGDERLKVLDNSYNKQIRGFQQVSVNYKHDDHEEASYFNVVCKENMQDKVAIAMSLINYPTEVAENEYDFESATFQVQYDDETSEIIQYNSDNFTTTYLEDGNDAIVWYSFYEKSEYKVLYNSNIYVGISLSEIVDKDNNNQNIYLESDRDVVLQNIYDIENMEIPAKYNLRDHIEVDVENQEGWGLCWDFAMTKSLETNYYLKYGQKYDLSEKFVDYMTSDLFYGSRPLTSDGVSREYNCVIQQTGIPTKKDIPYEEIDASEYYKLEKVSKVVRPTSLIEFPCQNMLRISDNKNKVREMIKAHIMNYGSVYVSIGWSTSDYYYNSSTFSMYIPENAITNEGHAISIIGWDDNYSRDNFAEGNKPKHDGAWIALNSWGKEFGFNDGQFYISYDSFFNELAGFLDSEPFIENNNYSWEPNFTNSFIIPENDWRNESKIYFVAEYEKDSNIEYLTNIIGKGIACANYYLLDDYNDLSTVDFSKARFIGSSQSYFNELISLKLDAPFAIEGNKFSIIIEGDKEFLLKNQNIEYKMDDDDIHTYYTFNELTNDLQLFDGDILLCAMTINEVQYNELLDNKISYIKVINPPNKTSYYPHEKIDVTGGRIKVYYENGEVETKEMTDEDVFHYGYTQNNNWFGDEVITVVYGGKRAKFDVEIRYDFESIEMYKYPMQIEYRCDKKVNIFGGELKVNYLDGTSCIVKMDDSLVHISPSTIDYNDLGIKQIEVEYGVGYGSVRTYYEIEVFEKKYEDFGTNYIQLSASEGDIIDLSGITINAYHDSTWQTWDTYVLDDDYTITKIEYIERLEDMESVGPTVLCDLFSGDEMLTHYPKAGYYWVVYSWNELSPFILQSVDVDVNKRDVMIGDLDGNLSIDIIDVRLLLQAFIDYGASHTYTEEELLKMDMNDDKTINIIDVRLLLQEFIDKG